MRGIPASVIGEQVESLCLEVSTRLPEDVVHALEHALEMEESHLGRSALEQMLKNARVASELSVPLCQDTGIFTVYLSLGRDTCIEGDVEAEVVDAVARATRKGALRASIVSDPLDSRVNTKDNTPPIIEMEAGSSEETTVGVIAKGGGSEMASRMTMLPPGAGWPGVLEWVVEVVSEVGARSCPPLVLGLGVGGSFDRAPALAMKALLIPLNVENPNAATAQRERELAEAVNRLGMGPAGVGGLVTCIGARIAEAPSHIANLPVALSMSCHALRRKVVQI